MVEGQEVENHGSTTRSPLHLLHIHQGYPTKVDEDGPFLVGIGTISEGGGFKSQKLRTYSGPHKSEQRISPGEIYVAMTNMAEETSRFLEVRRDFRVGQEYGILTHHVSKSVMGRSADARVSLLGDAKPCVSSALQKLWHRHDGLRSQRQGCRTISCSYEFNSRVEDLTQSCLPSIHRNNRSFYSRLNLNQCYRPFSRHGSLTSLP